MIIIIGTIQTYKQTPVETEDMSLKTFELISKFGLNQRIAVKGGKAAYLRLGLVSNFKRNHTYTKVFLFLSLFRPKLPKKLFRISWKLLRWQ